METTLTKSFEKGFLHGLAGVSKMKSRKQVLQEIVSEAEKGLDMAKGLQGRGDWHGAAAKVVSSAGLLDQAIDLAETLPGVNFERTRKQAKLIIGRIGKAMPLLSTETLGAQETIQTCENALVKAIEVLRLFSGRLNDTALSKDSSGIDFDEEQIIKEVDKIMLTGASKKSPGAAQRQRIGEQAGVFQTGSSTGGWEPVPGKSGRQRRKKADGSFEYRDVAAAPVAASTEPEDVKKEEPEAPQNTEEEATTEESSPKEPVQDESKELFDPKSLLQQTGKLGELAKAKKGKKVKPGSLKGGKSEPAAKAPIGSGERFQALVSQLASKGIDLNEMEKAVRDPKALAAAICRAKYGRERCAEMAAKGRRGTAKRRKNK